MARSLLNRRLRLAAFALIFLLSLTMLAVSSYTLWSVRRTFPAMQGTLALTELNSTVTVLRDRWGVPQIYADTPHDLFLAQGFVQAQDRFWQMDVQRHATQGRLAEMFGADLVPDDAVVRTLGWERVAARELELLSAATRRHLQAFSAGVNAYLQRRDGAGVSLEYRILDLRTDYTIDRWTPVDSLTWLKGMAWTLRTNLGDEIQRARLASALPADRVEQLYPSYPYARHAPIVRGGSTADGEPESRQGGEAGPATAAGVELPRVADLLGEVSGVLRRVGGPARPGSEVTGLGSNSWVVAGSRTETGEPILANDPHLGASLPSIWYQAGLHCTDVTPRCPFDVSGFTFPGLPGVVIGHNADIAWGFTNLGADVTDLFLERVRGDRYLYEGSWRPLQTRTERIGVAGGEPVRITVRASRHGPLLSDVDEQLRKVGAAAPVPREGAPPRGDGYAVALRWTALEPARTADALFALNTATSWEGFRDAAQLFAVPAQNLVYADTRGNIGYQAPGRIPRRVHGDGRWPVPGWTDRYEWDGYLNFAALPHVRNPERGYIVTANNAATGPAYPHLLTRDWSYGYRSHRIAQRIEAAGRLSVSETARLQTETYNPNAATLVPHLLRIPLDGPPRAAQRLLRDWDYTQPPGSAPAAYFNAVWRRLLALTFHDEMPEGTRPSGGSRWFEVVRGLLAQPRNAWWDDGDTASVETRDDVLAAAQRQAHAELARRLGDDPAAWEWGRLHALPLTHQSLGTSGVAAVEALFNRGPLEVGGGDSIVNATGWDASRGYATETVPSMRMVVSLADLDASRWVNLTGASGHAYSPHYTDQARLWRRGETTPFRFSRESLTRAAARRLLLEPA